MNSPGTDGPKSWPVATRYWHFCGALAIKKIIMTAALVSSRRKTWLTTLTQPNQCNTFGASSPTSIRGVAPFNSVLGGEAPILLRNQLKSDQCVRDKVMDTFKSKVLPVGQIQNIFCLILWRRWAGLVLFQALLSLNRHPCVDCRRVTWTALELATKKGLCGPTRARSSTSLLLLSFAHFMLSIKSINWYFSCHNFRQHSFSFERENSSAAASFLLSLIGEAGFDV